MKSRIVIVFLLPVVLLAQDASLTLGGAVVSSTGETLPHALVTILGFLTQATAPVETGPRMIRRTVLTDPAGAFRFSSLPANKYSVTAQKPGFQTVASPGSRTVAVDLKSSNESLSVVLSPLGVITGTVVDQYGQPMRGVNIVALTSYVQNGLRQTRTERIVTTDDRGAYRIWDLSSGRYYIKATGQGGATLLPGSSTALRLDVGDSFSPAYSGGGPTMGSAMPIEIGAGSHSTADFHLKLEPAWRISGVLRNFTPNQQTTFSIVAAGEEVAAGPDRFNSNTGAFQFKDVVAGSYILRATQQGKTGEVAVNVAGADASAVSLTLRPNVDIPVHVRFTNSPPAPLEPARIGPERTPDDDSQGDEPGAACVISFVGDAEGGSAPFESTSAGDDALHNVTVGVHPVSFSCFGGYIRSALMGTQDLLADPVLRVAPDSVPPPIEILATHGGGVLKGRVEGGTPADSVQYLLVPQFSGSVGPVVTSGMGPTSGTEFGFGDLAPGSYTLYAFARPDIEYRNPAFLQSLTGGQSIQIDDGKEQEVIVKQVIQ